MIVLLGRGASSDKSALTVTECGACAELFVLFEWVGHYGHGCNDKEGSEGVGEEHCDE